MSAESNPQAMRIPQSAIRIPRLVRCLCASAAIITVALVMAPAAAAHPLGNFSVNRYSRIEAGVDAVQLRYVLDLAEIPTLQELRSAGVVAKEVDAPIRQALLEQKAQQLASGARLTVDGVPVAWSVRDARLELLPGQADLDIMRVELTLTAPAAVAEGARFDYRDSNYAGRIGWHEVVVRGAGGISLAGRGVTAQDLTNELREYPTDATRAPLDVSSVSATASAGAQGDGGGSAWRSAPGTQGSSRFGLDPTADYLAALVRNGAGANVGALLLAIAVAVGLGALHALEPGHGKTLVGGYLVGSRGTPSQAVLLGLTVTVTHTLGVYALGLITLVAAQYILPERLYPMLGVASGMLIVVVGLSLVRSRLGAVLSRGSTHDHPAHGHGHTHAGHSHSPDPSHWHSHDHTHVHPHGGAFHTPSAVSGQPSALSSQPSAVGGQRSAVSGQPSAVSLQPSALSSQPSVVGLRSLLTLGISGGLLPCPAALVVLLAAVSFHNVAIGMVLVAAFSVGLAGVLTGIGLLVVLSGRWLGRSRLAGRLGDSAMMQTLPALSATVVTLAGLAITAQAARAFI